MSSYYLELLKNPLNFPPVARDINVFFDDCNQQVFTVSNENNMTIVHAKGPWEKQSVKFKVQDKGSIVSIKFSPDSRILAIQRVAKSVDFINFYEGAEKTEYTQSCKGRTAKIIGFSWTGANEIVLVTNQGIEFYQVHSDKRSLKLSKHYPANINWYVFFPECSILLLSSGITGNVIHPYLFKSGNILRLPKFEVENPSSSRNPQPGSLLERDVTVANIYNNIYVVVLRNQSTPTNAVGAEIVLYLLQKDVPAKKTAVLRLGSVGRFAFNVVDNLIAVHHQASKTSMIFDINLASDFDGQIHHYHPVLSPLPIEPYRMQLKYENVNSNEHSSYQSIYCEAYSPNWIVFQPNIIIDAKLGCLWKLEIKLGSLIHMIEDKAKLIDFLLLRSSSKDVIVKVINQALLPGHHISMSVIAQIFDKINTVYADTIELTSSGGLSGDAGGHKENDLTGTWFHKHTVLDQSDIYSQVFLPTADLGDGDHKFFNAVLLEYIRSLNSYKIPIEFFIIEFMINRLVKRNSFYQLHQFLQYHILNDSKPLALLLLSLEERYPPGYNLALDMMKRLGDVNEDIVETLLQRNEIVAALKYLQSVDLIDSAVPRKFLEASLQTNNDMLFYSVYTFFQEKNYRLRKSSKFVRGDQCEKYEQLFLQKFGEHPSPKSDTVNTVVHTLGLLDV